ncbi:NAD(P)/FAD-dependent oxidoreductase [Altererythrobacter fulvus]|uniref:NAD(P)/FAD-dependent oxidoreductase n=1 Tax=Caenibius fulvus TaxID=2126012 RepID=UPI00301A23A6
MRVGIIGAGIAGLSCAEMLSRHGHCVSLFDKGRAPGGRMSSRRMETDCGNVTFDHGAQFLVARDPEFIRQIGQWEAAGVVSRWSEARDDAWVGVPAMNAIPKHIAHPLDVSAGVHVRGIARSSDGWHLAFEQGRAGPFDALVIALPAEQAAPLLGLYCLDMARVAVSAPSTPCWAAMLTFALPLEGPPVVTNSGIVAWAARNNSKPGRSGAEAWTIHATPEWSREHLERDPDWAAAALSRAFLAASGTSQQPVAVVGHRWRFALSGSAGRGALWDSTSRLGVCGDWLIGPRVEAAWLSGRRLAEQILSGATGASCDQPMARSSGIA